MIEELKPVACAECGMSIWTTDIFLARRRDDHKSFYCLNGHANFFPKQEPPKPKPPTVIEREVEVIIEKEYEPKDFTEMLNAHEHLFTKKNRGQVSCQICGLYQGAYELLNSK
jgi:hypothetical protein